MDIINFLKSVDISSSFGNGKRMAAVFIVLNLINEVKVHLTDNQGVYFNEVGTIFSMLCLKPDVHLPTPKSGDLQFLLTYIPVQSQLSIANVLIGFTNGLLRNVKHFKIIKWLNVIPLIHIFKKKVIPFDPPVRDINWIDEDVRLHLVKGYSTDSALRYSIVHDVVRPMKN